MTPLTLWHDATLVDVLQTPGQRIKARRIAMDLTQAELGVRVGAHEKTVSRWENDRQDPESAQYEALARTLDVPEAWLRYGESRDTGGAVREGQRFYEPRATATRRLPPRVREHLYGYLEKLEPLVSEVELDEVERTMVESTFNKLHVYEPRNRSEEDLIKDIDAAWEFVRYVIRKRGIVV